MWIDKQVSLYTTHADNIGRAATYREILLTPNKQDITGIMNASMKSESTAKRILKDFIGWDFITKGEDGNYRIKMKEGSKVHEGSNGVHEPVQ